MKLLPELATRRKYKTRKWFSVFLLPQTVILVHCGYTQWVFSDSLRIEQLLVQFNSY